MAEGGNVNGNGSKPRPGRRGSKDRADWPPVTPMEMIEQPSGEKVLIGYRTNVFNPGYPKSSVFYKAYQDLEPRQPQVYDDWDEGKKFDYDRTAREQFRQYLTNYAGREMTPEERLTGIPPTQPDVGAQQDLGTGSQSWNPLTSRTTFRGDLNKPNFDWINRKVTSTQALPLWKRKMPKTDVPTAFENQYVPWRPREHQNLWPNTARDRSFRDDSQFRNYYRGEGSQPTARGIFDDTTAHVIQDPYQFANPNNPDYQNRVLRREFEPPHGPWSYTQQTQGRESFRNDPLFRNYYRGDRPQSTSRDIFDDTTDHIIQDPYQFANPNNPDWHNRVLRREFEPTQSPRSYTEQTQRPEAFRNDSRFRNYYQSERTGPARPRSPSLVADPLDTGVFTNEWLQVKQKKDQEQNVNEWCDIISEANPDFESEPILGSRFRFPKQ